ncbi:hypothetical protein AAL_02992 [Moelleriella libera RCEF 2490]|uniref:Uncharacterized protein n=1 Tax=Moelleriella libera RCEF 2490 TaxID=1081109 RepID=A0A168E6M3_9HYPO|nr:hypothetical protein AAL_02992 [Moelleriella libera RCEF 2490]
MTRRMDHKVGHVKGYQWLSQLCRVIPQNICIAIRIGIDNWNRDHGLHIVTLENVDPTGLPVYLMRQAADKSPVVSAAEERFTSPSPHGAFWMSRAGLWSGSTSRGRRRQGLKLRENNERISLVSGHCDKH